MKNRKWLTYLLGTVLSLITLAAVGIAGFRAGIMQSAAFPQMGWGERPAFHQNMDKNDPNTQGVNPKGDDHANPNGNNNDGNPRGNDFGPRGFDRGHHGGGIFSLIHIAILALLLWFGYKYVQKSGWRLVRVQHETSTTSEPVRAEVEEKKESE